MEDIFKFFYESIGVCTDTRKVFKDCLFICLKGDNFDGNTFAEEALLKGAKYVIVDNKDFCVSEQVFLVEDTLIYLQKLANFHRKKFNIPILGITGSNGKTTTKELINSVLGKKYKVLATEGNLNNHIGVPLTLLRLNSTHEFAVIEMGANKFGDIEELCNITEPNFGIITNIGKAHLEGFINLEGVIKTKKELYDCIEEQNGILFINSDDQILKRISPKSISPFLYGTIGDTDIHGELINLTPFVHFKWEYKDFSSDTIETNLIGKYNFYNFLAAVAIGVYFEVDFQQIGKAIEEYIPTNNRSQVEKTIHNTLILDCYNSNPSSLNSALDSFTQIENENKFFVLGDMLELGEDSFSEHEKIIQLVQNHNLEGVFVGNIFKKMEKFSNINCFSNRDELIEYLTLNPIKNKLILIKGSRGIGLEKIKLYV